MTYRFRLVPVFAATLALAAPASLAETPARAGSGAKPLAKGVLKGAGTPDLIIEPRYAGHNGLPQSGFCGPWNGGNQKVYFYVTNTGSEDAPASDAFVSFGGNLSKVVGVPVLSPGQSSLRSATIPYEAWGAGGQMHGVVDILIAADHNDDVPEADVTNNYGEGSCIGPAG